MRNIYTVILLGILLSCGHKEKVLYEELTPKEFSTRLTNCPVAYLPLGTLEWHGDHLPIGSDGIQSEEFFKRLAHKVGGIVLPMIFLGPDFYDSTYNSPSNGQKFYGMDYAKTLPSGKRDPQQLAGSAYWVPDSTFCSILEAIMYQLSRAGFKIVIAHGHTPSLWKINGHAERWMKKYNLKVMTCSGNDTGNLCFMCDHAAANETSIMMSVRPDLVHMENLPKDTSVWPLAIAGRDPRIYASKKFGNEIVDFEIKKMVSLINAEFKKME
jgi:creatinine amidohydrolase